MFWGQMHFKLTDVELTKHGEVEGPYKFMALFVQESQRVAYPSPGAGREQPWGWTSKSGSCYQFQTERMAEAPASNYFLGSRAKQG